MKLAILTSTATRHRYFARRLADEFDVVAVGYEAVEYVHDQVAVFDLTEAERGLVRRHFCDRAATEVKAFGDNPLARDAAECLAVGASPHQHDNVRVGYSNSDSVGLFHWLQASGADTVAVFGTSLIKPPLLDLCPGRMINMHLGLSPYYRGTATNFYPLLNGEPEYVGATIHLLDEGIDSGPIFRHARPEIVAGDTPHTIGCKAIAAGTDAMVDVLHNLGTTTKLAPELDPSQQYKALACPPVMQWTVPNARLYLRKDYHPRQVVELHAKFDGVMEEYLSDEWASPLLVRCNDV